MGWVSFLEDYEKRFGELLLPGVNFLDDNYPGFAVGSEARLPRSSKSSSVRNRQTRSTVKYKNLRNRIAKLHELVSEALPILRMLPEDQKLALECWESERSKRLNVESQCATFARELSEANAKLKDTAEKLEKCQRAKDHMSSEFERRMGLSNSKVADLKSANAKLGAELAKCQEMRLASGRNPHLEKQSKLDEATIRSQSDRIRELEAKLEQRR